MNDQILLYIAAGSVSFGALCYYIYRKNENLVIELQNIPRYHVDDNLLQAVSENGIIQQPYVAITGKAQNDGKKINGIHNRTAEGLIRHIYVKEYSKEIRAESRNWNNNWKYVSENWNVEPFSLCNSSGKIRVLIRNPLEANDFELDTVYDKYEPVTGNIADKMMDLLTGQRIVGFRTVEKMLLTNTQLTAVGKLIHHDGQLYMDKPDNGWKYFLTKDSVDSLIKSEQSITSAKKFISYLFLGVGAVFCLFWCYKFYKNYVAELEYSRLETENNVDDSCSVCLHNAKDIVLIPCGHICVCSSCVASVNNKCPICRKTIDRIVPMFRS